MNEMRNFDTGATRNVDENRLDFDGFLSPIAIKEFAKYMHENRIQADGKVRDSDNWQKGIPIDSYMKSMFRQFFDVWSNYRGAEHDEDIIKSLCALMFNVQGMIHEIAKKEKKVDNKHTIETFLNNLSTNPLISFDAKAKVVDMIPEDAIQTGEWDSEPIWRKK